ncbi:MAG TPA: FAD-binding oxidoreductase [Gammaproteobacteria bacterium]|nr:FAD-binding oxidoreductase [Gammaproteobacteria bacterium]
MDNIISVDVISFTELSGYVMQVIASQPSEKFKYVAGQYVQLLVDQDPPRPFSIANACDDNIIEFHVRHAPDNVFTQKLIQQIKQDKKLHFTGPFGELRYQNYPKYPLLFVAAGTGFAPCKAIIEQALKDKDHPEIYLYWTVRKQSDLYWHDQLIAWTKKTDKFKYIPVISTEQRIDKVVLNNHADFKKMHVYVGGPEEMVKDIQQKFSEPPYFYSDWLN